MQNALTAERSSVKLCRLMALEGRVVKVDLSFSPRLMKVPQAAQYIGVSVAKLRDLPIPAKRDGGNILYDRIDLDAHADNLPYDGQEENSCDAVFGIES